MLLLTLRKIDAYVILKLRVKMQVKQGLSDMQILNGKRSFVSNYGFAIA